MNNIVQIRNNVFDSIGLVLLMESKGFADSKENRDEILEKRIRAYLETGFTGEITTQHIETMRAYMALLSLAGSHLPEPMLNNLLTDFDLVPAVMKHVPVV